jgi:hypothetical protein
LCNGNTAVAGTSTVATAAMGLGATAWIVGKCYKFGSLATGPDMTTWFWTFNTCTAAATYTISHYADNACATAKADRVAPTPASNYSCWTETGMHADFVQTTRTALATELMFRLGSV